MKQLFEKTIKLIEELINIKNNQINIYVRVSKSKDATATRFKVKSYIKWIALLNTHILKNTQILNINDIKSLKFPEKLENKVCEFFESGEIKDIELAQIELNELEKLYKNYNDNICDSMCSSINSVAADDDNDSNSNSNSNSNITGSENIQMHANTLDSLLENAIVNSNINTNYNTNHHLDTSMIEAKPKILENEIRPTDPRGAAIFDLRYVHGIGPKNAIKLYENGVTLEGLLDEWSKWVSKDKNNATLMPSKMQKPNNYSKRDWDLMNHEQRIEIQNCNLQNRLMLETKVLNKIHRASLVGVKYFHDMSQKIPRKEVEKAERIIKTVAAHMNKDLLVMLCGSYRRGRAKSGDIDCLITHPAIKTKNDLIMSPINLLSSFVDMLVNVDFIIDQLDMGSKKFMGFCMIKQNGKKENVARRLDIRLVPYESYGSSILYFTGSKKFNTNMRTFALGKGFSLSEFGLTRVSDNVLIPCFTEEDVFKILNYPYKTPEERDI